jgi:hypothetical protein
VTHSVSPQKPVAVYVTAREVRNAYKNFIGKPERKIPRGRPKHRWVDNNRMDLREIEWEGVDWIYLFWLKIGTSGGML